MATTTLSYRRLNRGYLPAAIRVMVLVAPLLLLEGSASAESKWTHMHSENLDLYSETTTVRSQEILRSFEQIHEFLVNLTGVRASGPGTTCVVAFKSEEDFAHFRPAPGTVSFAFAGADRDYVVLGVPEADSIEPGARAYATLLSRQLELKLPPWLDEGLASFYATIVERGSQVIAGEPGAARRKALFSDPWASLAPVLNAGANSKVQVDQRFVLVHMLLRSPDYAPKFKDLVSALQSGLSSQAALEKTFGKPLSAVEKDLKAYSESSLFAGAVLTAGTPAALKPGEPASPFDVNLALAGLTNRAGHENDAQAWFDRLAAMNPERPEAWAGLGYVAMRRGKSDVAMQNFDKAISLGSRDPGVLWVRSRLANADPDSEESTWKLLDKDPTRADIRVKLAALELDQRRPGLAYSLLEPLKNVPAELTARFLMELAFAQLETGDKPAAQLTLAKLEPGTAPTERAEVSQLKDFMAEPAHISLGTNTAAANPPAPAGPSAQDKAEAQRLAEVREKDLADAREKATAEAREKVEAKAREKADAEARAKANEEARQKYIAEARDRAAAEAQEKKDAKARERADREAKAKEIADARQKAAAEAREKALAEANEKLEAKAREKAEADARAKAAEDARQKAVAEADAKAAEDARQKTEHEAVLAKAAKETRESAGAYAASTQPQQASNLVPDGAPAPVFPSMLTGTFVELGCGEQIKVVVQTDQGQKNLRIKNPANVIVSGKAGGTVELNCGPQKPTNVRIQYGPGEGGYDGLVEAIYFE